MANRLSVIGAGAILKALFRPALFVAVLLAWPMAASGATAPDFAVKSVLETGRALQPGEYVWDDDGVPPGQTRIIVDLAAQTLYVYRAGVEIGRAFIMYGDGNKPTPTGTFPILQKKVHHISNLYGAPMPYMMRLTWDGIAIHGSEVDDEYATHGCVGVPDEFAALLYSKAKLGDRVTITNGWLPQVYGA